VSGAAALAEKSLRSGEPRPEKVALVAEVREKLSAASASIITEYRGLTVKDLETLRRNLRAAGGEYKVYKNTLVRRAVHELGLEGVEQFLVGPTAITFAETDAVLVTKVLRDFGRANPALVIKGGVLGAKVLSAGDTSALADIQPRDVLLARLAGGMAAPLQQFAGLLVALPRKFAYALAALVEQRSAAPAESPESPEPATPAAPPPIDPPTTNPEGV